MMLCLRRQRKEWPSDVDEGALTGEFEKVSINKLQVPGCELFYLLHLLNTTKWALLSSSQMHKWMVPYTGALSLQPGKKIEKENRKTKSYHKNPKPTKNRIQIKKTPPTAKGQQDKRPKEQTNLYLNMSFFCNCCSPDTGRIWPPSSRPIPFVSWCSIRPERQWKR